MADLWEREVWALDWAIGNSVIGAPILMYFSDIACLRPGLGRGGGGRGWRGGGIGQVKKKSKRTNKKQKILQNFHLNKSMDFNYEAKCVLALTFFIVTFYITFEDFLCFERRPFSGGGLFPPPLGGTPPPLGPRPLGTSAASCCPNLDYCCPSFQRSLVCLSLSGSFYILSGGPRGTVSGLFTFLSGAEKQESKK